MYHFTPNPGIGEPIPSGPIVQCIPFIATPCKIVSTPSHTHTYSPFPLLLFFIPNNPYIFDIVCVYSFYYLPIAPHTLSSCSFYECRVFICSYAYMPQLRMYLAHKCRKGFKVKSESHSSIQSHILFPRGSCETNL